MAVTRLSIDTLLAVVFGTLTLLATVASIRYKDSLITLGVRAIRRMRTGRGFSDIEANRRTVQESNQQPVVEFQSLPQWSYLHWPIPPSPFDISREEQLEWQGEQEISTRRA